MPLKTCAARISRLRRRRRLANRQRGREISNCYHGRIGKAEYCALAERRTTRLAQCLLAAAQRGPAFARRRARGTETTLVVCRVVARRVIARRLAFCAKTMLRL